MDAAQMITKCRTKFLLNNPFFGALALRLKVRETEECETMATDGQELIYNKDFVSSLSFEELEGVLAHEVLHCAFLHHTRRGDRDPKRWNVAADYAINILLLEDFKFTLPEDRLYNPDYRKLSAEEIYNRLPPSPPTPRWGTFTDAKEGDKAGSISEQEGDWTVAVKCAAEAAKAISKLPGGITQLVEQAQAKVNWKEQLQRIMSGHAATNYNWYPPHQLYLQRRLHIPTLSEPSLGRLTFAIDTSGSVSNEELALFTGELQHILGNMHFEELTIIHCDTEIKYAETFESADDMGKEVYGRGGTMFEPVFDYCNEHGTDALIYFTDMEANFPEEPGYPVFWARTRNHDAPYGEHIDLFTGAY